jgi:hypothetical protein
LKLILSKLKHFVNLRAFNSSSLLINIWVMLITILIKFLSRFKLIRRHLSTIILKFKF